MTESRSGVCGRCYEQRDTLREATCNEKPEALAGAPLGQYHCPDCGMMVMAGLPHFPICDECATIVAKEAAIEAGLDAGIRGVVMLLRSRGFETCDSGDGVSKAPDGDCVIEHPHVFMQFKPDKVWNGAEVLALMMAFAGVDLVPFKPPGEAYAPHEAVLEVNVVWGSDVALIGLHHLNDADLHAARVRKMEALRAERDATGEI